MQELETQKLNQELFLQHEAYINKILEIRQPAKPGPTRWWQGFLNTAGGAALITIVIGGLFGGWISHMFQAGAKEREFQQSWLKARGDQAMLAYKDFVEKRSNLVTELYGRIGSSVSASEDLVSLSKSDFSVKPELDVETKNALKEYRKLIADKFETAEAEWRKDRDRLGLLMDYYHPEQPAVLAAWTTVKDSMTTYMNCSKKWHDEHPIDDNTAAACPSEKTGLTKSVKAFSEEIGQNRTYLWKGWEKPEELRAVLDK
jgi:hypothetical protein